MKILVYNTRGISARLDFLKNLVVTHEFDFLCLSECWRSDPGTLDTLHINNNHFNNNCHIYKNSSNHFQGTSTYSKDRILAQHIKSNTHEIIHSTFTHQNEKILLINSYLSPSIKDKNIITEFFSEIITICNNHPKHHCILVGDINAKHNNIHATSSPNYAGLLLTKLLSQQKINNHSLIKPLTLINNAPTRVSNTSANLLDVILSNKPTKISYQQFPSPSDHDFLILTINTKQQPTINSKYILYEDCNKSQFTFKLKKLLNKIRSNCRSCIDLKPHKTRKAIRILEKTSKLFCSELTKIVYQECPTRRSQPRNTFPPKKLVSKINHLHGKLRKGSIGSDLTQLNKLKSKLSDLVTVPRTFLSTLRKRKRTSPSSSSKISKIMNSTLLSTTSVSSPLAQNNDRFGKFSKNF